jgi:hypothetical protein
MRTTELNPQLAGRFQPQGDQNSPSTAHIEGLMMMMYVHQGRDGNWAAVELMREIHAEGFNQSRFKL